MITSIVVNYHCAALTGRAVNSLLSDMPDGRIVVVDNSVDGVEVATLKAKLPDPQVRLVISPRNVGFGAACNLGMDASDSPYVMLLNPDACVLPGCLQELSACLDGNPSVAAVSPMQHWDAAGEWLLPPAWLPTGPGMWSMEAAWRNRRWAQRLSRAYRRIALKTWNSTDNYVPQRALSGGAMMVRRSVLGQGVSLFDPAFFMYYEDSDLSLRLRRRGWALGLAPRAAALHEWVNGAGKSGLMEPSKAVFLAKHFTQRNHWQTRLSLRIGQQLSLSNPLDAVSMASTDTSLNVPAAWQGRWLLEVSPSPLLIPAIGHLGSGPEAQLPLHLIDRLGAGPVYLRLGPARSSDSGAGQTALMTRVMRSGVTSG